MVRTLIVIAIVILAGYVAYRALAPQEGADRELPGVDVETDEIDVMEDEAGVPDYEADPPELDPGEIDIDVVEDGAPEAPPDPDVGMEPQERVLDLEPEPAEPEGRDVLEPGVDEEDPTEEDSAGDAEVQEEGPRR